MRRIFVKFGTGYCGEDGADVFEAADTITGKEIESWCEDLAYAWAESYGREPFDDGEEDEWYTPEKEPADIWWHWEDYEPKKHDMYRAGGGSFEEDF